MKMIASVRNRAGRIFGRPAEEVKLMLKTRQITAVFLEFGGLMRLRPAGVFGVILLFCACTLPGERLQTKDAQAEKAPVGAVAVQPMLSQPAAGELLPGLAVVYFRKFQGRHLDFIPQGDFAREMGRPGPPIPYLNHAFGKGEVFDSGEKTLIAMRMQGLLRFPDSGRFQMRAFINDCIRVYLNGRLVIDEPRWNEAGDRFTGTAEIDVQKDAWYPLTIEYFQRKGTATIQLFWRDPRQKEFDIIPAEAYAHLRPGR